MPDFQNLHFSTAEGIARITLNRPEKRNALDGRSIEELREALDATARDDALRVILLRGAGPDFCSGADLGALDEARQAGVMANLEDARRLADLFLLMRRHRLPIVAAVRGRALAGGCGLATACDLVLAAGSATFGYPEVGIGFVPAMVMAVLRRSVTEKRAFELLAGGRLVDARTAMELGMVNQVFPDRGFEAGIESYVTRLAGQSHSAVRLTKALLYQMDSMSFEAALGVGAQANALARMTDDFRTGLRRFLKKP